MKPIPTEKRLNDRLLGDQWSDWQPFIPHERATDTGKSLFIIFSFAALLMLSICFSAFWYLVLPRIEQLRPEIARFINAVFLIFQVTTIFFYTAQALSSIFKIKLLPSLLVKKLSWLVFLPITVKIAGIFGISRDRIANSFLKFHNDLMLADKVNGNSKNFIILLPRCLSPETRKRVAEICDGFNHKVFTVFGGDEARAVIFRERPAIVLAVACERDLISGMQDIMTRIPVLGLPNKRPEGPCKNTLMDTEKLAELIEFCAGT